MKLKANQLNEDPKLVNNSFYESLILNSHFSLAVVPCIILCCFASSTFDFKLKECSSILLLHSYSVILMMVFFMSAAVAEILFGVFLFFCSLNRVCFLDKNLAPVQLETVVCCTSSS